MRHLRKYLNTKSHIKQKTNGSHYKCTVKVCSKVNCKYTTDYQQLNVIKLTINCAIWITLTGSRYKRFQWTEKGEQRRKKKCSITTIQNYKLIVFPLIAAKLLWFYVIWEQQVYMNGLLVSLLNDIFVSLALPPSSKYQLSVCIHNPVELFNLKNVWFNLGNIGNIFIYVTQVDTLVNIKRSTINPS